MLNSKRYIPSYPTSQPELLIKHQILPHLPPRKKLSDYKDAAELRSSFNEQIAQLVAAGLFSFPDWTAHQKNEIQIPTRDGSSLRALVYRPNFSEEGGAEEPGPLYVHFHGGGWSFGMPEYGEGMAEVLVKEMGVTVVSVGYRLSPEYEFPTAAEDAVDAVRWVCIIPPLFSFIWDLDTKV
jgi:acetyl esterase/lipase